jgi:uncharacterized membrane-anchored protein YhcB (DUF1043 family)
MTIDLGPLILAASVLLGGGFLLGRQTGAAQARVRDLLAKLETAGKEREFAQASLDAATAEIARIASEREEYGSRVVDHFTATSELMRALTVQYRAVYDHLTRGATSLCPEGSVGLQDGLQPESLGEGEGNTGEPPKPPAATDASIDE